MAGEVQLMERLAAKTSRSVQVQTSGLEGMPPIAASGQRPLLVARDGEAVVIAHLTEEAAQVHGVHSHNPVIVRLVEGYIELAGQKKLTKTR
jgi:HTH-type transcriptional regulator, sugar sensing transcriptional regulator